MKMKFNPITGARYGQVLAHSALMSFEHIRNQYPHRVWDFNPATGEPRDADRIAEDPFGHEYDETPADIIEELTPTADRRRLDSRQVGGDHYSRMEITPWQALEAWLTPEEFRGYLKGEAIVYLARERAKGGAADVSKARHVLEKLEEIDKKGAK